MDAGGHPADRTQLVAEAQEEVGCTLKKEAALCRKGKARLGGPFFFFPGPGKGKPPLWGLTPPLFPKKKKPPGPYLGAKKNQAREHGTWKNPPEA